VTKISAFVLLVLGLFAAACASSSSDAAGHAVSPPAPSATAAAAGADACSGKEACAEACADACAEGCTKEGMPAPVAKAASPHLMKEVKASADYPLSVCVVSGEELGELEDRAAFSYDGTEVQFCCPGCASRFKSDPAKYLAKIAAAKK
jgi:YHS domain-containing protein